MNPKQLCAEYLIMIYATPGMSGIVANDGALTVNLEEIIILCFEVHLAKGYKWFSYHPFAR